MDNEIDLHALERDVSTARRQLERTEKALSRATLKKHHDSWKAMEGKHYIMYKDTPERRDHYRKVLAIDMKETSGNITVTCVDVTRNGDAYKIEVNRELSWFSREKQMKNKPFEFIKEITEKEFEENLKHILLRTGAIEKDRLGHEFLKFSPYYLALVKLSNAVKEQDSVYFTRGSMEKLAFPDDIMKRMIEVDRVLFFSKDRGVWVVPTIPFLDAWNKYY